VSLLVGCANSVPVECPEGFALTDDKMDCVPVASGDPDAGPFGDPPTCQELDCDDGDECTLDGCADALCTNEALKDGSGCTYGNAAGLCLAGKCIADCSKQDCRPVYPCTEQGIRDAIRDGGDVIIGCESPTTVTLTEGVLEIDKDLSLDGLGNLTIDADQKSLAFTTDAPSVAELVGIGITGGFAAEGRGAISVRSETELTLRGCRIFGNRANSHGGSLGNSGTLIIIDSEITENVAGGRGGGLSNNENLTVIDSVIAGNHALDDGGGIYNTSSGVVILERTVVKENLADDAGGGIWTSGPLVELKNSSVTDNRAGGGAGGIRMWTSAEVRATDSIIARNVANREGGGILNRLGVLKLERTVVSQNASLDYRGGGIYNTEDSILEVVDSIISENFAQHGGAMYQLRGTSRFVRSAVINNVAAGYGGAFRVYGRGPGNYDLTMDNCTMSGNEAGEVGGGVTTRDSVVWRLAHSTLVGNEAPIGAAIQQDRETIIELASTAIHGSCDNSEDSPLSSLGFNAVLDLGAETCMLNGTETDQTLSDEEMSLGALSYNGGPTPTHVPNPGSLLIDVIPAESCAALLEDQRGEPRGNGSPCDVGAVEVQATD
jgi:hypothetical protein